MCGICVSKIPRLFLNQYIRFQLAQVGIVDTAFESAVNFPMVKTIRLQFSSEQFRMSYFRKKSHQAAIMQLIWEYLACATYMEHVTPL